MTEHEPNSSRPNSGRYRRIATLGQGGMARVLLTLSRSAHGVEKLLVVKELRPELENDPEFLAMFLNEARIAARLNHPNVMQTYEVSQEGSRHVIVMEYLDGQPLNVILSRIGRKNLSMEVHLRILADALAGLHYAHELRDFDGSALEVVHRDVSPHNIFVTYDGIVKLVDFGIAKVAGEVGATKTGVFKGKIGYAAPEQIAAAKVDRRADVFAMGVMLWEALARRRMALAGEPEAVMMARRLAGADTKLLEVVPDAPPEVARICERALARQAEDRYATAGEMRAELEVVLEGMSRAGQAEVGKLLRETFAKERVEMHSKIDAGIKALAEGGAPLDLAQGSTPPSSSTLPKPAPKAEAETVAEPPRRKSGLGRVLVVAGALATLAAFVVVWRVGATQEKNGAQPSAPSPTASETSMALATSTATTSASAAPAQATATIELTVSATPPEARLFLDEVGLASNPFHGALPKSVAARKLRVTSPGFVTEERLVVLDRDLTLDLALKRDAQAPVGALPKRPPTGHGTAAPVETTVAPGTDLRPPSRPATSAQHNIDDHL